MKEVSEYKLVGYYLVVLYEKIGLSRLKYEQIKTLTDKTFSSLDQNSYSLVRVPDKLNIVKDMISKGVFQTSVINGKKTFTQKYNYEINKYMLATYSSDGNLMFKLPKEITESNMLLVMLKKTYDSYLNLELKLKLDTELEKFAKIHSKIKM